MSLQTVSTNQEWLRILGKGMITLPKAWREELGLKPGEIVQAKKQANKIIIEAKETIPYRIYQQEELENFLKNDQLPVKLAKKADQFLSETVND